MLSSIHCITTVCFNKIRRKQRGFLLLNYDVIFPNIKTLWNVSNKTLPIIAKVLLKLFFFCLCILQSLNTQKVLEVQTQKILIIFEFERQTQEFETSIFCVITVYIKGRGVQTLMLLLEVLKLSKTFTGYITQTWAFCAQTLSLNTCPELPYNSTETTVTYLEQHKRGCCRTCKIIESLRVQISAQGPAILLFLVPFFSLSRKVRNLKSYYTIFAPTFSNSLCNKTSTYPSLYLAWESLPHYN
jgi:hypothetical protein